MKLLYQTLVSVSLFNGVQILSLDIFDQSDFNLLLLRILTYDNGNLLQTCDTGSAPAAFTGDDLIILTLLYNHNGFDDTELPDGVRQLI